MRPTTHVVHRGDTLWGLGRMYGVPWPDIAAENRMHAPYVLEIGQRVAIPGSGDAVEPATYRVEEFPTTHRWPRPGGPDAIQWIVVHSPAAAANSTVAGTLRYLARNDRQVSYNYLVDAGTVYTLAGPEYWVGHAGSRSSRIPGTSVTGRTVNYRAIAVSLYDGPRVRAAVAETGAEFCADLVRRLRLPDAGVVLGHGECDPGRRSDPVGIDMNRFRAQVAEILEIT